MHLECNIVEGAAGTFHGIVRRPDMVGLDQDRSVDQDGCAGTRRARGVYKGSSLVRNTPLLGPYRRPVRRVLGGSSGVGRFLMGEVPLYVYLKRN